jgi:hypothetical protein
MTTLKAGGLDFFAIGGKRYGHDSAQNVAGGTVQPCVLVLNTRIKTPNYHSLCMQASRR